jgi:hypothetical protein
MKIIKRNLVRYKMHAALVCLFMLIGGAVLADQDKYALVAPNGIAFSEFRGYEQWQDVAESATDTGIKAILANPVMIEAYKKGIPGNGEPFPDGSVVVKIQWYKVQNPVSPYSVEVPSTLKSVAFIEKDSKRFPNTSGWGYARNDGDLQALSGRQDAQRQLHSLPARWLDIQHRLRVHPNGWEFRFRGHLGKFEREGEFRL